MATPIIRRSLAASGIRAIFDSARRLEAQGARVLHLEIGRPDWQLPPGAAEQAKKAIDDGLVNYITNRGLPALRELLADEIRRATGRRFDSETEVAVTIGASEAICMAMLVLLGDNDEVIVPEPAWHHYQVIATMAGARPLPLPLAPEDGFALRPESLKAAITPRTKMIVLNSPGNPTGAVQSAETLEQVAKIAMKHGIFVLSDEVYDHFVYDGEHISIGRFMADTPLFIYVNSFSKTYSMTGWRVGYTAAEKSISDAMNRVHQYLTVCGVPFAQKGVEQTLRSPDRHAYVDQMREAFKRRRDIWLETLSGCPGFQCRRPEGAFYLFPRIEYRGMNGQEFCRYMLEKHHVAMVAGEVFGAPYGQHVRISYGLDEQVQKAAAEKLAGVLRG